MFARFFIDRPIFAWVVSIVILLGGGVAYFFLPTELYPNITPPTVQVSAAYPGANAVVVANTVAAPIEQQVNGVERMLYMSSQSTNDGNYTLTITFEIGTDVNVAQVLVQNRVALAQPQLPPQVQLEGVNTKKSSPSVLLVINLISPERRYDSVYMSNFATIQLKDELLRLKGVGDILMLGERDYSMRVWLDPYKLATRSLTASDVINAIQSQNVQVAAGTVGQQPVPSGQPFQLTMSALGRLDTERQFGDIILKTGPPADSASSQGGPSSPVVYVRDVARVELGAQNYDITNTGDGQPSTSMAVFLLPGANALAVADAIKERMKELKSRFPPGLEYDYYYDTTPFIQRSIEEVLNTLVIAVLLVGGVVLFFLQDWKAMILPMIDVPVSLVGTFAVMALLGFSLNNLTLFGLVLAIGIVVDDAIMVLENIERLMATGLDARTATIKAMDELTGPIVAITLVLSSVFLPSCFIPGLTGQFYRQFALTIAASVIISAVNAMTLTPSRAVSIFRTEEHAADQRAHGSNAAAHHPKKEALPWWIFGLVGGLLTVRLAPRILAGLPGLAPPDEAASALQKWLYQAIAFGPGLLVGLVFGWFLIGPVNAVLGWFFRGFNRIFDAFTAGYGWGVGKMLRLSVIVLVVYAGLLGLTVWRVATAPTGFIPTQDQGYLLVNVQLPDSASVQRTDAVLARIDEIARRVPGVAHTVGVSGEAFLTTTNGPNLGTMFVGLKPFEERTPAEYDAVIAAKIQQECGQEIQGAIVSVFRAPPIQGLGNAGGFKLQTEQRGYVDLSGLQTMTDQLVQRASTDPHYAVVFTLYRAHTPQLFVDIDRAKVQSLQVPIQDVFTTLQVYMGGFYVNQFNKFGRTWQVNIQADPESRTSADILKQLFVRSTPGQGQQGQMVPLGTLLRAEDSTGPLSVMRYNMYTSAAVNGVPAPGVSSGTVVQEMTRLARELDVPFEWTEMTFLQVQAGNLGMIAFVLGAVLVYLVLAAKYESWRLPLAVILVVPMCLLAAVMGMTMARMPVDIFVQIGFLVLVGLACKNAILIVEFAQDRQHQGEDLHEAALGAARIRFRPIVMTSLAFIGGVFPLVVATGAGAEMRQSLGTAVFAGMIGVAVFGVFLTPVFFFVLMWFGSHDRAAAAPATPAGASAGDAAGRSSIPAEVVRPPAVPVGGVENGPSANLRGPAGTDNRGGTK
jgi:multidrug efflux pump